MGCAGRPAQLIGVALPLGSGLLPPASLACGSAHPVRIEFPAALHHITARGDAREDIYRNDGDRRLFLGLATDVCERFSFNWWGRLLPDDEP